MHPKMYLALSPHVPLLYPTCNSHLPSPGTLTSCTHPQRTASLLYPTLMCNSRMGALRRALGIPRCSPEISWGRSINATR